MMDTLFQPQTPTPALAVLALLLAALAAALFLGIWWRQLRELRPSGDVPELLLTAAARGLPEERRHWGAAMLAELAHLRRPAERWRFALECAWVAAFPPRRSGPPAALTAGLGLLAAAATYLAVGRLLPELRVFATALVALMGGFAALTAARSRRVRLEPPGAAVLLGVAGCVATTFHVVGRYPWTAHDPTGIVSVLFAALLAGYLWVGLAPPRALAVDSRVGALGVAAGAAMPVAIGLVAPALYASSPSDLAWLAATLYQPAVVVAVVVGSSALAAQIAGSWRAGVVSALWAGMVSALLVYPLFLLSQVYGEASFGAHLRSNWRTVPMPDREAYLSRYLGEELASCIVALVLFPALSVLLGMGGAALGAAARRASSSARAEGSEGGRSRCRRPGTDGRPRLARAAREA